MLESLLLLLDSNQTLRAKIRLRMHKTLLLLETDRSLIAIADLFATMRNLLERLAQVTVLCLARHLAVIIELVHVLPVHLVVKNCIVHYLCYDVALWNEEKRQWSVSAIFWLFAQAITLLI